MDLVDLALGTGRFYNVEVARSDAERSQGLRGRSASSPMLLVYDHESTWPLTMTGVRFPLDLIAIDSNGFVVGVTIANPGATGPIYPSLSPYQSVLELPAGSSFVYSIKLGSELFVR